MIVVLLSGRLLNQQDVGKYMEEECPALCWGGHWTPEGERSLSLP